MACIHHSHASYLDISGETYSYNLNTKTGLTHVCDSWPIKQFPICISWKKDFGIVGIYKKIRRLDEINHLLCVKSFLFEEQVQLMCVKKI